MVSLVEPKASDYIVEVALIPTSKLFVDHRYQRSVSHKWVSYLVKEWDWHRYLPQLGGAITLTGMGYALNHLMRFGGNVKELPRKLGELAFVDLGRRARARQESLGGRISPLSAFASVVIDAYNYKRTAHAIPPYSVNEQRRYPVTESKE